jgi:nucleoside-diphosphate-sugar epimerase
MKVVITGAAGLIGRAAVTAFIRRGWEVVGISRSAEESAPWLSWVVTDLADGPLPAEVFAVVDALVHLAAIPGPGVVSDPQLFRNNVCATFDVLHSAGEAGVRRAVVASSISIYGLVYAPRENEPTELPLSETSELRIADTYALTKETDEATARMMARRYGMSVISLRFPNISSAAVVRERAALAQADPTEGHREFWAYLTTEDAAEALIKAATADFKGAVVANCVSPSSFLPLDFGDTVTTFHPTVDARGLECGYTTDVARDVLGFEGRIVAG